MFGSAKSSFRGMTAAFRSLSVSPATLRPQRLEVQGEAVGGSVARWGAGQRGGTGA